MVGGIPGDGETLVNYQMEILELGSKIQTQVKEDMTNKQREYYLRQQLKAIEATVRILILSETMVFSAAYRLVVFPARAGRTTIEEVVKETIIEE